MIPTRGLTFEVATHGTGERLALLLHGFPESAHAWRHQIPLLASLGYRVWAPNLRGYGHSDKPLGRRAYTLPELERDISDLIDASGASSILLVGHDWGGAIAWSYAANGSRPIERLVVMNCPHPQLMLRGLLRPAQLKRSWYFFFFQLPRLPERLLLREGAFERAFRSQAVHPERFTDADVRAFRDNAHLPGAATAMVNYYRGMPLSFTGLTRRGPQTVAVPTLLIWGEQDQALGKELTQGTERYVQDLTLRFIPDASHWVQQDTPEEVNRLLAEWLPAHGALKTARTGASRVP